MIKERKILKDTVLRLSEWQNFKRLEIYRDDKNVGGKPVSYTVKG